MILIGPSAEIFGSVEVPGSKSLTNRALVAAAVADGGTVRYPLDCDDTRLLASALRDAGWEVSWDDDVRIGPRTASSAPARIWLGDSGTGARLMIALLAATPGRFVVDGSERLRERPMAPLIDALRELGASVEGTDGLLPVTIDGRRLRGGQVTVRPEVSSQFVSALLLAGPLMEGGLEVEVSGSLPSRPYIQLTVDTLTRFHVAVEHVGGSRRWRIPSGTTRSVAIDIEGDWSAVAFFVAAAAVAGGRIEVEPLSTDTLQGDRVICDVAQGAGMKIETTKRGLSVAGPATRAFHADLTDAPDLFPALAAMAAGGKSGTELSGLEHLKHKESDRLTVMVDNLRTLGAGIDVSGSTARFDRPLECLREAVRSVTAAGDHRIAMAMAVAALAAGPLQLDNPDCVTKSFPGFWNVWNRLVERSKP